MLKGISPIISPELLKLIAEMGHGDELVLADANFPGASIGKRCIRCDGHGCADVMRALLTLSQPPMALIAPCTSRIQWRLPVFSRMA